LPDVGFPDVRVDARVDGGRTLVGIAITPPTATLAIGTRLSLIVTGTYSDGTTADLTTPATFSSSAPSVSLNGKVTHAHSPGPPAVVTARVNNLLARATTPVSPARIMSTAVTPATATTGIAGTVAFTAVATLTDGSHQDVTNSVTWTSSDTRVATISAAGLAR